MTGARSLARGDRARLAVALAALAVVALALWRLDAASGGVEARETTLAGAPATLYRPAGAAGPAPLVVVAHGFAGSHQMMDAISRALARAGLTVVAFDFIGHGRHPGALSPDVERIEGTTAQLVAQTRAVIAAAAALEGAGPLAGLVGHSMATDIVIRAAAGLAPPPPVAAISMYSEAVTADFPPRLLIVSGAWEGRLREIARDAVALVDPAAGEGETAEAGGVARRAAAAPGVGHVGVLYSPATLAELRGWLAPGAGGPPPRSAGGWTLALLVALVALAWPLARLAPAAPARPRPPGIGLFGAALVLPAAAGLGAGLAAAAAGGPFGLAGFGALAAFFAGWGAAQIALLRSRAPAPARADIAGFALMTGWGLVFALALDAHGAAFLPTGPRAALFALLAAGTVPFALAATLLSRGAPRWRLPAAALAPILALAALILLGPGQLGLVFTVLPVMVLFALAYGAAARWIAARSGPWGAGAGLGLCLAWAIASSTPLFAAP